MPTLNWCYGVREVTELESTINEAIFAAHSYRNKLCELELAKRDRHYQLLRDLAPEFCEAESMVNDAEAQLAFFREAIQEQRKIQKTKRPKNVDNLTHQVGLILGELKLRRAELKTVKHAAYTDPKVIAAIDRNIAQHREECRAAKAASGLYWGTEAIVKQACNSFGTGAPPRFKRYKGEGQIAVQLQGGLDCADATTFNTLCYLVPDTDKFTWCYFRVASDGGKPIFAKIRIVQHRPLPEGKIKWAYLERRKIADHVRWTLRLNVDIPSNPVKRDERSWCAVHYGWRVEASGLRVALWKGSDGRSGALRLSHEHLQDYTKLDATHSKRSILFNETVAAIRQWCKDKPGLPDWLTEVLPHMHCWKYPERLARLLLHWRSNRFDGDDIFDSLDAARKQDKHMWQHERRLAVRIVRRRNDMYRVFAKQLSSAYGVLYHCKIEAKKLTENTTPEELENDNTQSHRNAKSAAISTLWRMLEERFLLYAINVSSDNLTRECSKCGDIDDSETRRTQCRGCGVVLDRDENALANTIARGAVMHNNGELLELATAQRDKEQKQKEKLVKMQEANRAARKSKRATNENKG